jgi:GntR family transcriptional repressor for pyruvate dehydrogenase complex
VNNQNSNFEPINDGDISQAIARQIKGLIRVGKLETGDRLPGERELTRELGVSRASLREAFRALQATGFVKVIPGKGTYIQDPSSGGGALESVMWPWLTGSQEALVELFEVRELLEVEAAGLAAERATPAGRAEISKCLAALADAVARHDLEEMALADIAFHRSIFLATGNTLLLTLIDAIGIPLRETRRAAFRMSGGIPQTFERHAFILKMIQARDPRRAQNAMRKHLESSRDGMLAYLSGSNEKAMPPRKG